MRLRHLIWLLVSLPGAAAAQCAMSDFAYSDCDSGYWLAADFPQDAAYLEINGIGFGDEGQIVFAGTSAEPDRMSGFTGILSAQGRVVLYDWYSPNDGLVWDHLAVSGDRLFQFGHMTTDEEDRVLFLARGVTEESIGEGLTTSDLTQITEYIYGPSLAGIAHIAPYPGEMEVIARAASGGLSFGIVNETGEFPNATEISDVPADMALSTRIGDRQMVVTATSEAAHFILGPMPSTGLSQVAGDIPSHGPNQELMGAQLGCSGEAYFLFSDQRAFDPGGGSSKEVQIETALHRVSATGEIELRAPIPTLRQGDLTATFAPEGLEIMSCSMMFSWGTAYDDDGNSWPAGAIISMDGRLTAPLIWPVDALQGGRLTSGAFDRDNNVVAMAGTYSDGGFIVIRLQF